MSSNFHFLLKEVILIYGDDLMNKSSKLHFQLQSGNDLNDQFHTQNSVVLSYTGYDISWFFFRNHEDDNYCNKAVQILQSNISNKKSASQIIESSWTNKFNNVSPGINKNNTIESLIHSKC